MAGGGMVQKYQNVSLPWRDVEMVTLDRHVFKAVGENNPYGKCLILRYVCTYI